MKNLELTSRGELKPDVLLVDYLGLMCPISQSKNDGLYERGLKMAVELRALAQIYDIPVIAAAQTNRDSFENRVGQDKISESIGIAQTADLLLTINRDKSKGEGEESDLVEMYLAKSRFSKNDQSLTFKVDYDCMRVEDYVSPNVVEAEDAFGV
jgi:replicative DNA helicase